MSVAAAPCGGLRRPPQGAKQAVITGEAPLTTSQGAVPEPALPRAHHDRKHALLDDRYQRGGGGDESVADEVLVAGVGEVRGYDDVPTRRRQRFHDAARGDLAMNTTQTLTAMLRCPTPPALPRVGGGAGTVTATMPTPTRCSRSAWGSWTLR